MYNQLLDSNVDVRVVANSFVHETVVAVGIGEKIPLAQPNSDESRPLEKLRAYTMRSSNHVAIINQSSAA